MNKEPKQHHYVPSCYSKNFTNEDGYIIMSDLWNECRSFPNKPDNALKSNYMYSQPVHAEQRFDNAIETTFSQTIESDWYPIVEKLKKKATISQTDWRNIVEFICAQHTRVPNCFDAVISLLRKKVFEASELVDFPNPPNTIIELYKKYTGDENSIPKSISDLIEAGITELSIDEHACITSMAHLVRNIPIFQFGFSFGVPKILHNKTNLPFISSDNPVSFFSGKRNSKEFVPYKISKNRDFSFVLPISSNMALVNENFLKRGRMHVDIADKQVVSEVNRITAMFSYRYIFAEDERCLSIGKRYKSQCPSPDYNSSIIGDGIVYKIGYKFSEPNPIKNNWEYDFKR